MKDFLMVGVGGFVGSIARYGVFLITLRYTADKSYWATVIVNLVGCFLIGILSGGYLRLTQNQNLLLITGICGGFTTFSTFALDGLKLIKAGNYAEFATYLLVSVIGGLLVCMAGLAISK